MNRALLDRLNEQGKVYLTPSEEDNTFFLRMVVCSRFSEKEDMDFAYQRISELAAEVLAEEKLGARSRMRKISRSGA